MQRETSSVKHAPVHFPLKLQHFMKFDYKMKAN